jgi:hypothetical protein
MSDYTEMWSHPGLDPRSRDTLLSIPGGACHDNSFSQKACPEGDIGPGAVKGSRLPARIASPIVGIPGQSLIIASHMVQGRHGDATRIYLEQAGLTRPPRTLRAQQSLMR